MGSFFCPITIIGPQGEETIQALVDTGATLTVVPRPILERLGVRPVGRRRFSLADGRLMEYEIGSAIARLDGQELPTICVFGDADMEPLIGVVTLESFFLGVDPVNQTLIPVPGRLKVVVA